MALFARFPPETDQAFWVVKQALDIGLMGVIFNRIASREEALAAVRMMRDPPMFPRGPNRSASAAVGPVRRTGPGASAFRSTNVELMSGR